MKALDNWSVERLDRTYAVTCDRSPDGRRISVELYVDDALAASASGSLDEGLERIAVMAIQQATAEARPMKYRKAAVPVAVVDPCEEGEG